MWDLRNLNRGIFLLISVLTGCAILYNAWGPILALIISIIFVIYVCYSLLTNDSIIISPNQTFIFIKYIKEACQDINGYLNLIIFYFSSTIRKSYIILNKNYRIYVVNKMNKFRQNHYQLSNDNNQETTRNSSIFDLTTNQLSPISRNDYRENISYNNQIRNDYAATKLTSTPLAPLRKDANVLSNGVIGLYTPNRPLRQETQLIYGPNHTSVRSNESVFSPEGSPWGTSISPKIRSKAGGVKTVQTVAGPLLASTRYNIDPKVYSDVTSPGLSTRLAKYATEANSKLTHQSQYGTGQFPKVNLSASPLPLISAKNVKVKIPVTVRIAPPEASGYSPPGERQKLISDVCRAESKASSNVVQVLREISLKRHASREDVSSDLVKKQRTDGLFDENLDNFEEESKQKRTREDSPNTDEEILDRNNQLRPIKKTKTPSCFDVLNSLSSSNQYSSGVKRKASTLDLSRSGTPDIEKHFKPSETMVQNIPKIVINVSEPQSEIRKAEKQDLNEKFSPNMEIEVNKRLRDKQSMIRMKGILKNQIGKEDDAVEQQSHNRSIENIAEMEEQKTDEIQLEKKSSPVVKNKPVNFRDKLFMKAGPENNERLRTMIQEQGNIRAKFTTDDVEEIKKEDIVNMRQTSMRARLQSMFDAISGKPSKKINPDVIIHAEGAGEPATPQTTSASLVTLNSTTSTTNINTSPIATSLVAPTVADAKLNSTTVTKHVTFNLPSTQSSVISQSSSMNAISTTEIKTNTTATSISNSEAPKLSFGTVLSSTKISTSPSTTNSTMLSFPNIQNTNATTVAALSSSNSNTGPTSFMNSTQSSGGTPSLDVSSSINNSSNLVAATTTVAKVLSPSSSAAFTTSNYSNVNRDVNVVSLAKTSTTFGTVNMPSSVISSGNFTSESNKAIELAKTSTQTSSPMPNFSFGASKTSNVTPIFGGNVKSNSINTQNQTLSTTNVSNTVAPSINSSFVTSGGGGVVQTQQSGFNATSTTGGITVSSNNPTSTTSSLFSFGGGTALPQSTNAGSFSFTTNTNTGKGQIPAFGSASTQNSPAFGSTGTQNPPSYENTINFQNNQSSGINSATTTTQNAPSFGNNNLSSNQNPPPAFGSAVTTAQNVNATFGTVASSAPAPAFGSTTTTNSSFAFGNTTAQTPSTISTGFGTNNNSTAPSTATTSATNSTFSFGSSATSTTKSNFAFGSNAPATTTASNTAIMQGTTGNSNQMTAFGSNTGNNSAPVFGAPSTTAPPAFGTGPTTSTPAFGAPSSTASSVFGGIAATVTPAFGAGSSTTATPLFGSPATTTTTAMFDGTVNQSTFGNVSNSVAPSGFGTPKTTAPPAFGSNTNNSGFNYAGNTGGNSLFSGTSLATTSNNSVPATASSTFGENAISKSVFGQNAKPPPSFAASTSGSFGSSGTANFGNPNSSFGTNSNPVPAGNPPAYGTQNSTTSSFGTQNQTVKQTPQGAPPPFGSTNSAFGSTTTAPPAFGANTSTPSGFGSSTSTFGTQNTNAQPSFGSSTANTAQAFGSNVSATFGGQSQTSTPAFGAQNSAASSFGTTINNNSNATFGFGGNQTVQQQQNPGFPFSGTAGNTNNNATTAAPFQFGSTTAKSEEFNFNASTSTPNMNFGATSPPSFGTPTQGSNIFGTQSPAVPAGGMFSIGAGSTAPRSRSSRTRRQR